MAKPTAQKLTTDKEKLFNDNREYALRLPNLYPKLDQAELSSIAYHALYDASMNYDKSRGVQFNTYLTDIFHKYVYNYVYQHRHKGQEVPMTKPKFKGYGETEHDPLETHKSLEEPVGADSEADEPQTIGDIIPELSSLKTEDSALYLRLKDELDKGLTPATSEAMDLLLEGYTGEDMTKEVNKKYNKSYTRQRYLQMIQQEATPIVERFSLVNI